MVASDPHIKIGKPVAIFTAVVCGEVIRFKIIFDLLVNMPISDMLSYFLDHVKGKGVSRGNVIYRHLEISFKHHLVAVGLNHILEAGIGSCCVQLGFCSFVLFKG